MEYRLWREGDLLGDEGVNLAKVFDDLGHKGLDAVKVGHVELVDLDLDAVLVGEILCVLLGALLAGGVGDCDVGAHLGAAAGGLDTHAARARGAGDGDDLALEAEEVLEGVGLGDLLDHVGGLRVCLGLVFGDVVDGADASWVTLVVVWRS